MKELMKMWMKDCQKSNLHKEDLKNACIVLAGLFAIMCCAGWLEQL